MLEFMSTLFFYPERLLLLLCAPIFLIILIYFSKIRLSTQKLLSSPDTYKKRRLFYFTRELIRITTPILAYIALVIAYARPHTDKVSETVHEKSRDLLILLDISRSMAASDTVPNRLKAAIHKIKCLLDCFPTERVGLVLFAGTPFVQVPLTIDHGAFLLFLNAVDTNILSSGSTYLDKVLTKGVELYEQVPENSSKLLLLVTDGDDFSQSLTPIKQRAIQSHVTILILGMGTEKGAPIPIWDQKNVLVGYEKDKNGNPILSKRNDNLLSQLATETGGFYVPSTVDDADITVLCNTIKKFEATSRESGNISHNQERYGYPLSIALIALFLEWIFT